MEQIKPQLDIVKLKSQKNSVTINSSNISTGIIYKHKPLVHNTNNWHKFVIFNTEGVNRATVLNTILKQVHPLDLIPVNFMQNAINSYFLARNCGAAIEKLCNDNLVAPHPLDPTKVFRIQIVLKFTTVNEFKIDVQANILSILSKKFQTTTKELSLRNFADTPGLNEFCPLYQPKIMYFVLHLAKGLQAQKICLADNEISLLNPLETIVGPNVVSLDLSNNSIADKEELKHLKLFPNLTEIRLCNNPFCTEFDSFAYTQLIKQHCPNIQKIDDVQVWEFGMPAFQKDFICDLNGFDLVNEFVESFFTAYDSQNRNHLEELYHKEALFSLTVMYQPYQLSSAMAQLKHYNKFARNLKTLSDYKMNSHNLYQGASSILGVFGVLPLTEHDPYSFKTDLLYFTGTCAAIQVTGLFRDLPVNLLDPERLLGFTRTFVLACSKKNEYCIVNEELHVYNALNSQLSKAFSIPRPVKAQAILSPEIDEHELQMIESFQVITNLKRDWAKKLLVECLFDLKKTLMLFIDMYTVDKIPPDGFERRQRNVSR